jgi:type IV secretory pathway VirB4 component
MMNDLPRLKIGFDNETKMPVYITDRYVHILLLGKSGTGKSTSISNWWEQDHYFKNAKVLVDPSGFLASDANSISRGNYCSLQHPISINPMKAPYTDSQVSDLIAECINQVIKLAIKTFTPKMRNILDDAIKYCLKNNRRTLLNVRDYILNLRGDGETRDGILARLNFVLSDESMVKILCGGDSVEWGELIKKRETFILDCFGMSKDKMVFAGNVITQGIKNYFRYDRPKEYLPLSLYIDEAHNFVNPNLFDILNEARKYKISCVLSSQSFANVDDKMARVMCNMGTIISYRLGSRDAQMIANEMGKIKDDLVEVYWEGERRKEKITVFNTKDILQNLEKYHVAYMTPKVKGIAKASRPPFFIPVKPPTKVEPQRNSKKPSWFTLEPLESYPQTESP